MSAATRSGRPANSAVSLTFWLTAAVVLTNGAAFPSLTGLVGMQAWPIMLPVLFAYLFLASLAVRVPLRWALGAPGFLIVAALASHLVIGSVMAAGAASYPYEDLLKYGYFIVAIVAAAVGGSLVLRRAGIRGLATGCLIILGTTCCLTLASPVLMEFFSFTHRDAYYRFVGVFSDPNDAGYVGCLAVVLALALLASHGRHRKLAGAVLVLGTAATILSSSRTSIPALGLILLIFSLSAHRFPKRYFVLVMGAASILAFVLIAPDRLSFLPPDQIDRLSSVGALSELDVGEDNRRLYLWQIALPLIAESPGLGNGLGEFHRLLTSGCGNGQVEPCGVHNLYLLFLGEAGVVPLALFLLFLGSVLWLRLRCGPSIAANTAAGWTLILAVHAVTFHHLPATIWCGFVIGLTCAMAAYAAETAERAHRHRRASARHPPRGVRSIRP